ncbi:helix-turn-helix transcriptional regulator [Streptomyces roseoverticillatus]|uniref:helix-turn-helix domain-containing protein n=1 Tax=Streptomyces roseoverticillatus TaxID=66429 RepID=UPI001F342EA7|nr:helix-turn-helix transcriptional regulator [Streptomyces roseoverticillatus]MCF3106533.1 helix-turn-helix transcriptional regulator [Streptomyces roseoverticillatus]
MADFDAIDSLLAAVGPEAALPAPGVRRELRERARLSKAQVARALGVSPSTVAGWEGIREPSGEIRTRYAYLLDGLAAKFEVEAEPEPVQEPERVPAAVAVSPDPGKDDSGEGDDVESLTVPEPCVLCGRPAGSRVAGFAQHLDPADCQAVTQAVTAPAPPAPEAAEAPARQDDAPRTTRPSGRSQGPARRAFQEPSGPVDLIGEAVRAALAEHQGDVEAATAALLKRAIPDAMRLLDETRKGARYDVVAHPWIPDILRKQTSRGADQIWEARPKWTRHQLPPGRHEVTALDINGAYLSALKTHLPLGQLEHSAGLSHDRRRAGVHLITPPAWDHEDVLPNPIGRRDEPGPLWVTEPTLRLLLRLSGPKYGLCEPPEIHESYTSGATENLLEKFRVALKDARDAAIAAGDEVTLEYVKAMYSKFVSTMGESNYNRELYRPDWMHIIRSQAFANLWMKALKAHDEGLTVVRAMGTDELHVIGDWRRVFAEGRGVTEVKVKDAYTADAGTGEEK